MRFLLHLLHLLFLLLLLPLSSCATQFSVGPGQPYTKPSQVVNLVQDGDTVNIAAGTYTADVAVWKKHNLLLRGTGGYAHLEAAGANAQGKAIWVIQGNNTTVEYIEFSGCAVPDNNGAGIRQEGTGLTVRHCYFHDNQEGILAGDNPNSDILIEHTEFAYNGAGDGYSHNLYINHVRTLTFRFCYSHGASVGHNLKTRAHTSYILYNRIMDEQTGTSSYTVDMPNGGRCYLIGNLIQQGPLTENSTIVEFGAEGYNNPARAFYAVNNTVVNDKNSSSVRFFKVSAGADTAMLLNNLYVGPGIFLDYPGTPVASANLLVPASELADAAAYDYHLLPGAVAIDAGAPPPPGLAPEFQYAHPLGGEMRVVYGAAPDAGAYEFPLNTGTTEPCCAELQVWPNPSGGLFRLSEPVRWSLFDAQGRPLCTGNGAEIDLQKEPEGVYFLLAGGRWIRLLSQR